MNLTSEIIARFVGGQLEVQNEQKNYIYRGQIKTATVNEKNDLAVEFEWNAKGDDGFPPLGWTASDVLTYNVSLNKYSVSDIGPSRGVGDNRLCLMSSITGETVVLFPPNGSRLDLNRVKGL